MLQWWWFNDFLSKSFKACLKWILIGNSAHSYWPGTSRLYNNEDVKKIIACKNVFDASVVNEFLICLNSNLCYISYVLLIFLICLSKVKLEAKIIPKYFTSLKFLIICSLTLNCGYTVCFCLLAKYIVTVCFVVCLFCVCVFFVQGKTWVIQPLSSLVATCSASLPWV